MKLGVNSILFGDFDMETAFKHLAMAGYDGIEISAIGGTIDHLPVDRWLEAAPNIKKLVNDYNIELLAMEQPSQDFNVMEQAFHFAIETGVPIINMGPGGKMNDEALFQQSLDNIGKITRMAEKYGVTLCVKAHVGAAIYNTPTTLRLMEAITSPAFGIDMDPSHIYRANENPVEAIKAVIHRVKHVHIRDCKGRGPKPGMPELQANGRGDIDLIGYIRVLHENGYTGPLNLEVIFNEYKGYSLTQCAVIAAESRGHMQACLQACGAR